MIARPSRAWPTRAAALAAAGLLVALAACEGSPPTPAPERHDAARDPASPVEAAAEAGPAPAAVPGPEGHVSSDMPLQPDASPPWNLPRTPKAARVAAISRDGALVATGHDLGEVRLWSARARSRAFTLTGQVGAITALAFSADGRRLASAAVDGTVRVWFLIESLDPGRPATEEPAADALEPARREALVGAAAPFNPPLALDAHHGAVRHLEFSGDGRLLSAGDDGEVRAWTLTPDAPLRRLVGGDGPIRAATWSPDGQRIAAVSRGGPARVWEIEPDRATPLARPGRTPAAVAFSRDGDRLAVVDLVGAADLWRRADDAWTFEAEVSPPPPSRELAAEVLALTDDARAERLWSALGPVLPPDVAALPGSPPIAFLWIADGRATLRSAAGGRPRGLPGKNPPIAATVSPDGAHVVVIAADATVRAWGVAARD